MLFTIITVTKNNLKGLQRTHKSLGAQTCRDYEWIVIDGASDDGTKDYLASTKAIWSSAPDKGIYDAMNKGIPEASGKYVLFLNAGDMLAGPWVLEKIRQSLRGQKSMPGFIYGDSLETRPDQPYAAKKARAHRKFRRGMFTHHQAMFYRRELLRKMRYNLSYRVAADYDLTCRFMKIKKLRVMYIKLALCIYESGGMSQRHADRGRMEQAAIRAKLRLCNPVTNGVITRVQSIAWKMRQKYPGLYHGLKAGKL